MAPLKQSDRRPGQLQTASREKSRLGKRKGPPEDLSVITNNSPAASSPVQLSARSRACDGCRRRKTRCDSAEKPNSVCTNCTQAKRECTFVQPSKPRGPPKAYITGLEDRVELLEDFVKRFWPDLDLNHELGSPIVRDSWKDPPDSADPNSFKPLHLQRASKSSDPEPSVRRSSGSPYRDTRGPSPLSDDSDASYDSDTTDSPQDASAEAFRGGFVLPAIDTVEFKLKKLSLRGPVVERLESDILHRFHGMSGGMQSVRDAFRLQRHFNAHTRHGVPEGEPQLMNRPVRRSHFWRPSPWETRWEVQNETSPELFRKTLDTFPPADLQEELLDLYFVRQNTVYTLLHQPTFLRQWRDKLYEKDIWFAGTCLGVFALGSKWSDDPRVLPPDERKVRGKELDWTKSGFHYCKALLDIHVYCRSLLFPATLFEVQTYSLLVMYLRGTMLYLSAWTFNSFGLLKAQDVGAHLKSVYVDTPTVEQELWKRAFWNLVWNDRVLSHGLGRSCALGDESFDADYPVEVDDEYWENEEDPSKAFCQPADVPCRTTAFVLVMKLIPIMGIGLRSLYTSKENESTNNPLKHKDQKSKTEVVAEMNKLLAEWLETLPPFLQWGQTRDAIFTHLSCNLRFTYFFVQFLIYRPFLPTSPHFDAEEQEYPTLTAQAMPIMKDAAKRNVDMIQFQVSQGQWPSQAIVHASLLSAGLCFLILWHTNHRYETLLEQGMEDIKPPTQLVEELLPYIQRGFDALDWAGKRWSLSLQIRNLLDDLMPSSEPSYEPLSSIPRGRTNVRGEQPVSYADPIRSDPRFDPYTWQEPSPTPIVPSQSHYQHQYPRYHNMPRTESVPGPSTSRHRYGVDSNTMPRISRVPERTASRQLPIPFFAEQVQSHQWQTPVTQHYNYMPEHPSAPLYHQADADPEPWENERDYNYGVSQRTSNTRTELPPIDTRHVGYPTYVRRAYPDQDHIPSPVHPHYSDPQSYLPRN